MPQLEIASVVEHSFREHLKAIDRYCTSHRDEYFGMGALVAPDQHSTWQVWTRACFAILSANATFEQSQAALGYVCRHAGCVEGEALSKYGMTPNKAKYLNDLPRGPLALTLTRQEGESYHTQRLRLYGQVAGLGLAKASFLVALLDPLRADVACVDTHMQRVYLHTRGFRTLKLEEYLAVESQVRVVAERHHVSTFLAQWMIWDHARGKVQSHAIFPGGHK